MTLTGEIWFCLSKNLQETISVLCIPARRCFLSSFNSANKRLFGRKSIPMELVLDDHPPAHTRSMCSFLLSPFLWLHPYLGDHPNCEGQLSLSSWAAGDFYVLDPKNQLVLWVASLLNDIPLPTLKPIWQQKTLFYSKLDRVSIQEKLFSFVHSKIDMSDCLSVRWCPIYRCPLNSGISLPAMFDTGGYHNDPMSMAKPHCWWRIHVYISQDIIICPWLKPPYFQLVRFQLQFVMTYYKCSNPSFLAKMPQFSWSVGQSDTSFLQAMNPTRTPRRGVPGWRRPKWWAPGSADALNLVRIALGYTWCIYIIVYIYIIYIHCIIYLCDVWLFANLWRFFHLIFNMLFRICPLKSHSLFRWEPHEG